MSFLSTTIPFDQCDSDTQNVTSTGGAISALFTNLSRTTCREIILQNRGTANLLIGNTLASATYNILPGDAFAISPKDLSKVFVKSAGATGAVDIFMIV